MFDKCDAQLNQQHIQQTRRDAHRHQLAHECAPQPTRWPRNAFPTLATVALIFGSLIHLFK